MQGRRAERHRPARVGGGGQVPQAPGAPRLLPGAGVGPGVRGQAGARGPAAEGPDQGVVQLHGPARGDRSVRSGLDHLRF